MDLPILNGVGRFLYGPGHIAGNLLHLIFQIIDLVLSISQGTPEVRHRPALPNQQYQQNNTHQQGQQLHSVLFYREDLLTWYFPHRVLLSSQTSAA